MKADIAALRQALAAGPTLGPWKAVSKNAAREFNDISIRPAFPATKGVLMPIASVSRSDWSRWGGGIGSANAAYIAAASPDRIARLLDALEACVNEPLAAQPSAQPAQPLTDEALLKCVRETVHGEMMRLTRDVGAYEVTEPTPTLRKLADAIVRAAAVVPA